MLGGRLLSSRGVAMYMSVPLHNRRYEGCSTLRIDSKILLLKFSHFE